VNLWPQTKVKSLDRKMLGAQPVVQVTKPL
jgi:hypothetical protein